MSPMLTHYGQDNYGSRFVREAPALRRAAKSLQESFDRFLPTLSKSPTTSVEREEAKKLHQTLVQRGQELAKIARALETRNIEAAVQAFENALSIVAYPEELISDVDDAAPEFFDWWTKNRQDSAMYITNKSLRKRRTNKK